MATIGELVRRKALEEVLVKLDGRQTASRRMYVTMGFKEWSQNGLRHISATHWGGQVPVRDQVIYLLRQFRSGEPLHFDRQFNFLNPVSSGVWELKTGDVRIFGWFVELDLFIASVGEDANFIKQNPVPRYERCIRDTVSERDGLDLDDPKFIQSTDPRHVIST